MDEVVLSGLEIALGIGLAFKLTLRLQLNFALLPMARPIPAMLAALLLFLPTIAFGSASVNSLSLSPQGATLPVGASHGFRATVRQSDQSLSDVSGSARWSVTPASVANITAGGVLTAIGTGAFTVTAVYGGLSESASGKVVAAAAATSPVKAALPTTQQNEVKPIPAASPNPVKSVALGQPAASSDLALPRPAVLAGLAVSTSPAVLPVLSGLVVSPVTGTLAKGMTRQFTATGGYADGNWQKIQNGLQWSSSDAAVLRIDSAGLAHALGTGSARISVTLAGKSAVSEAIRITAATVMSVAVSADHPSVAGASLADAPLAAGSTRQFTALATYTDSSVADVSSQVTWHSTDARVARVSDRGLATGLAEGNASIVAVALFGSSPLSGPVPGPASGPVSGPASGPLSGSVSGFAAIAVAAAAPPLTAITVAPSSSRIASGTTQQFLATGVYWDATRHTPLIAGSPPDLSGQMSWRSSNSAVVTVSPQGLARGVAPGTAVIEVRASPVTGQVTGSAPGSAPGSATGSATSSAAGPVTCQVTVVVTAATLISLAISPSGANLAMGGVEQFTLRGIFSDGSRQDLTSSAMWSSLRPELAAVSTAGLSTGIAPGKAEILAEYGGKSAATTVAVSGAWLISAAIRPLSVNLARGTKQQFRVSGNYSDGMTRDLTSAAKFSTSDERVLGVSTTGLASAMDAGPAQISAIVGGVKATTRDLMVTASTLQAVVLSPHRAALAAGTTQRFRATGTFSDGSTQDLSSQVVWRSGDARILALDPFGLASGGGVGSTQVWATLDGISSEVASAEVTEARLTGIAISPASRQIARGTEAQFKATGQFTDGSTEDLSSAATWISSDTGVVSIDADGLATGTGAGLARITAFFEDRSASTTDFEVSPATLVSIAFEPAGLSMAAGTSSPVAVMGKFSDGTVQEITSSASFVSSRPAIAAVNSLGQVRGLDRGTSSITALVKGIGGSFGVAVTGATLRSISITPVEPGALAKGRTGQFTATGTYSDGRVLNVASMADSPIVWSSADPRVAIVDGRGVVTATGVGTDQVTASYQGKSATSASFMVTPAVMASISVRLALPQEASLLDSPVTVGASRQLKAFAIYTDQSSEDVSARVRWSSSAPAVAAVDSNGQASARSVGTTSITALLDGLSGAAVLRVPPPPPPTLTAIVLHPSMAQVPRGIAQQFKAMGEYSDGSTENLSLDVSWQSTTPSVAMVDGNGLAATLNGGRTQLWASYEGLSAMSTLTVSSASLVSLAVTPAAVTPAEVTPAAVTLAGGTAQQYKAIGTLTDGSTEDLTNTVMWTSSNANAATIHAAGFASAHNSGTTMIAAQAGSLNASAALMVTAATPVSVQLWPTSIALPAGGLDQLLATAVFTDGNSENVTSSVSYASSDSKVATVTSTGKIIAVGVGKAIVSARMGAPGGARVQGSPETSIPVTVNSSVPRELTMAPSSITLAAGVSAQLMATGLFSDASTEELTRAVRWTSSNPQVASVTDGGSVLAAAMGTATITASWRYGTGRPTAAGATTAAGWKTASSAVTVTGAVVTAITVSPALMTLALGQTQTFKAVATMSDGSQQALPSSAQWSVSDPSRATISQTSGCYGALTAIAPGAFRVAATLNGVLGSAAVTVGTAGLRSLRIGPDALSMPSGIMQPLVVTASYTDGTTADVTGSVSWSSANPSIATVSSTGVVRANGEGSTALTAALSSLPTPLSAVDTVRVTGAALESIAITPVNPVIQNPENKMRFTAIGHYSDGSAAKITELVHWAAPGLLTGSIGEAGVFTATGAGTGMITATLGGVSASTGVTMASF